MRWKLTSILGIWLALAPAVVQGQAAEPDNVKRGRVEFDAGRESLRQGDLQGALAHLRTSLSLHVSPGTLLNLASVEEKLGLFASASAHYEDALRMIPAKDERVAAARERLKAIEPRIPTFHVQFQAAMPPGMSMSLDGKELPAPSTAGVVRADPGAHVLVLAAPGHLERRLEMTLQAGDRQTIIVPPLSPLPEAPGPAPSATPKTGPVPTAAPTPAAVPSAVPTSKDAPSSPFRTGGLVAIAIGGAAAIAGSATGGASLAKKQELDSACSGEAPRTCAPELQRAHAEGELLAHASTAAFVLAGVAIATGITLLVVNPGSRSARPAAKVAVGPTGIVVQGRF
jgi:hypothetical protein